jgi:hypothetical protein
VTRVDCVREADVLDAIASRRWPDRAGGDLVAHVAECAVCSDVACVAAAVDGESEVARAEAAAVPPATVVWIRAEARARADAARQAARPIAVMQTLGALCVVLAVALVAGVGGWWLWTNRDALGPPDILPLDAIGFVVRGTLVALGVWLVLASIAVYLVAADD